MARLFTVLLVLTLMAGNFSIAAEPAEDTGLPGDPNMPTTGEPIMTAPEAFPSNLPGTVAPEPAARNPRAQGATPYERVMSANLMNGYPDGKFHGEGRLTRAQLANILNKTFKISERNAGAAQKSPPSDVPARHWAAADIQAVLDRGIMTGYRRGRFYPNQTVSRAEALAIFAQAYGVFQFDDATVQSTLSQYPDGQQIPVWARKSMVTALKNGFVDSQPGQKIRPAQPMTRGDMAFALDQYLNRLYQSEQRTLPE